MMVSTNVIPRMSLRIHVSAGDFDGSEALVFIVESEAVAAVIRKSVV
jgi:hypothetical protein